MVRNGLIQDVGANVAIPADAVVIDGEGMTVYPGLVDALSTWGMPGAAPAAARSGRTRRGAAAPAPAAPAAPPARGPEDRPSTTSWIKAADEIQPSDKRIESARSAGSRPRQCGRRADFSPARDRWSICCRMKKPARWCWFLRWDNIFR